MEPYVSFSAVAMLYDAQQPLAVVPYDAAKLKVLRGATRPRDAKLLVGDGAREYLVSAASLIAKPIADLESDEPLPSPHWDAHLRFFFLRPPVVSLLIKWTGWGSSVGVKWLNSKWGVLCGQEGWKHSYGVGLSSDQCLSSRPAT